MMFLFLHTPQILIGLGAALVWLVYLPWHRSTHDLMLKLSDDAHDDGDDDSAELTAGKLRERIRQLEPEVVQKYMKAVCHDIKNYEDKEKIPMARSLRMEQEGQFLVNGQWVPFTATQEFSSRYKHAGFVWDAAMQTQMSCIPVTISVLDAYINGEGTMKAQLPGGIPIVRQNNTRELNQGQLMRWAAEAPLFPLALLPSASTKKGYGAVEETSLKWLPSDDGDENSAVLELMHHSNTARMIFRFDPDTHLITSIEAKRHRAVDGGKYELSQWHGFMHDYEEHGGMMVPTRMEVGWKLGDDKPLEIYFKGTNSSLIYLMNNHQKHAGNGDHEHVD